MDDLGHLKEPWNTQKYLVWNISDVFRNSGNLLLADVWYVGWSFISHADTGGLLVQYNGA